MLVVGAVTATVQSWPAYLVWRAARRIRRAIVLVVDAQQARLKEAVVNLPRGGAGVLSLLLAGPALSYDAIMANVLWLQFAVVEPDAGNTFFQRVPRRFFDRHGWLEPKGRPGPPAHDGPEAARRKYESELRTYLDAPIERGNDLTETFIGQRIRRIRNRSAHFALEPHAEELSRASLAAMGIDRLNVTARDCLRFQLRVLGDTADYLEKLAAWLREPAPASR
jgi:hypothetical protein